MPAFIALMALTAAHAHAVLTPNIAGDRVDSLPKGRFMATAVTAFSAVESRFTPSGGRRTLESEFNRGLSWRDIVTDDPTRTDELSGLLRSQGVNLDDSAGRFTGSFRGRVRTIVPVLGYGVTDRIGIFAALPLIQFHGESRVAYVASPSSRGLTQSLQASEMVGAAKEFTDALNNGFAEQVARAGYDFKQSDERSLMGDLQVVVPIALSGRAARWRHSVQPFLSVPTGHEADPRDLYAVATGTGAWAPGVKGVTDFEALRWLRLTGSLYGQMPLPHHGARRVPRSSLEELMKDTDPDVKTSGGFTYGAQLDARFVLSRSWSVRGGLQHQQVLARDYRGAKYAPWRYRLLSEGSAERLESAHVAVELNFLQAFLDGDFLFPGLVMAGAAFPLSGQNALADNLYVAQVALFF